MSYINDYNYILNLNDKSMNRKDKLLDIEPYLKYMLTNRMMIDYYYALKYMKTLVEFKVVEDEAYTLGRYYIPILKGMLNRCKRRDQKDWPLVYKMFGFKERKEIDEYLKLVLDFEINLNYIVIFDDRKAQINCKLADIIKALIQNSFYEKVCNTLNTVKIILIDRGLQLELNANLQEYFNNMKKDELEVNKIPYKSIIKSVCSFEDAIYIINKMRAEAPGSVSRGIYVNLTKFIKNQDQLILIKKYIKDDKIELNLADIIEEKEIIRKETELATVENDKEQVENDKSLTKKQIKKQNREEIIKAAKSIVRCNSFEEALEVKNELLQQGIIPDNSLYYELIFKCDEYRIIKDIVFEMKDLKVEINNKTYYLLVRKCSNYEEALEVVSEMEKEHILPSVKLYYLLIRKSNTLNDALYLYEKFKSFYLIPDANFIKLIALKTQKTDLHYKFEHLKYVLRSIEELAPKINNKESAVKVIEKIQELDVNLDIELFNLLIGNINNYDGVKVIIDIKKEYNLAGNAETYLYVLRKFASLDCLYICYDILEELEEELDQNERKRIIDAFKTNSKYTGGLEKYFSKKEIAVRNFKSSLKLKKDFFDKTYLLGVADGLEEANENFQFVREEITLLLEEIKQEGDYELNKYDIRNAEGKLDGIDEAERIYRDIKEKELPLKIIGFVENKIILDKLSTIALSKYFYKATPIEVNNYNINSFNLTSSIDEFYSMLENVDYNKYDVSVNIISDFDSRSFLELYPETIQVIEKFKETLCIRFLTPLDNKDNNIVQIFQKMYKDNAMDAVTKLI